MDSKYPLRMYWDEECSVWVAEYFDLNGCVGTGETVEEAIAEADIFKEMWLKAAQESGADIPTPSTKLSSSYSGKFLVRVATSLHRELVLRAEEEGVSLNSLCSTYLSKGLASEYRKITIVTIPDRNLDTSMLKQRSSSGNWSGGKAVPIAAAPIM